MAALKLLVIVMGVAIVGMVALIGITIAKRFAAGGAGAPAVEAELGLPPGTVILSAMPADGQLALTLRLPDGTTRAAVVDLASGRTVATVRP